MSDRPGLDWDKKIETVCGKPAKLLTRELMCCGQALCLVGITKDNGDTALLTYQQDGTRLSSINPVLRNKMRTITKWYNLYRNETGPYYYDSKAEAVRATRTAIATLSVDIEVPCELDVPYPRPK
jgi:hypothetical protein